MKYRKGYKYQLAEDYKIQTNISVEKDHVLDYLFISADGLLKIRSGYAWDGASGPTYDTKNSMRGSLVHDALYQLMRFDIVPDTWRHYSDNLLRDMMIEDGMFKWRAKVWCFMVKKFAGRCVLEDSQRKVYDAP